MKITSPIGEYEYHVDRVSLSATGFYATPGIHYDRDKGRGRPFHYFAFGAFVSMPS